MRKNHSIRNSVNRTALIGLLCVCLGITVAGCGSGGGSSYSNDSNVSNVSNGNRWVTIDPVNVSLSSGAMWLNGKAFVSLDYVILSCAGAGCVFGWFDDSYPGVDVTWKNLTTGAQGAARSRYGTLTHWEHLWSAYVTMVVGINKIRITAVDPAGNYGTANISLDYLPPAPNSLLAEPGDGKITLDWDTIQGATSYKLYWSTSPGLAYPNGATFNVSKPPFLHDGLTNGIKYYYVITTRTETSESGPSLETEAIAGTPSKPDNVSANLTYFDINLSWDFVPRADTYTLYWSNEPGVTKNNGNPITSAISPHLHTGLAGLPYYYVVTGSNRYGEGKESEEVTAFPPVPPPTPSELSATLRPETSGTGYAPVIDLAWQAVPGADFEIYRCAKTWKIFAPSLESCVNYLRIKFFCAASYYESIGTTSNNTYADWSVYQDPYGSYSAYGYFITARNSFGASLPTDTVVMCSGKN